MKIMIIEDDVNMRTLLRTLLEMDGFSVNPISEDNNEGDILESVFAFKPEVILMDVHLKNLNGLDLLRTIKRNEDVVKTRIIMTSGMDLRRECIDAGADGYLQKPYVPDELIKVIKTRKN